MKQYCTYLRLHIYGLDVYRGLARGVLSRASRTWCTKVDVHWCASVDVRLDVRTSFLSLLALMYGVLFWINAGRGSSEYLQQLLLNGFLKLLDAGPWFPTQDRHASANFYALAAALLRVAALPWTLMCRLMYVDVRIWILDLSVFSTTRLESLLFSTTIA